MSIKTHMTNITSTVLLFRNSLQIFLNIQPCQMVSRYCWDCHQQLSSLAERTHEQSDPCRTMPWLMMHLHTWQSRRVTFAVFESVNELINGAAGQRHKQIWSANVSTSIKQLQPPRQNIHKRTEAERLRRGARQKSLSYMSVVEWKIAQPNRSSCDCRKRRLQGFRCAHYVPRT